MRIALPADELREHPIRPGLSTVTSINITESGQSVWTSLATPSTAEYETDVYADELPTAESMAKEVMATNLVVNDRGVAVDSLLEEEEGTERVFRGKETRELPSESRTSSSFDRRRDRREGMSNSFVPRRSPDLGATTFPLAPSIGPGSGSLGPEAGRSPSRLSRGLKWTRADVRGHRPALAACRRIGVPHTAAGCCSRRHIIF